MQISQAFQRGSVRGETVGATHAGKLSRGEVHGSGDVERDSDERLGADDRLKCQAEGLKCLFLRRGKPRQGADLRLADEE